MYTATAAQLASRRGPGRMDSVAVEPWEVAGGHGPGEGRESGSPKGPGFRNFTLLIISLCPGSSSLVISFAQCSVNHIHSIKRCKLPFSPGREL